MTGRIMSPELAFTAALKKARGAQTQGKSTITKGEAERALDQLAGHPHTDAAARAKIVQSFLDGAESKALSPKARELLQDFVKSQGQAGGGQRADELKASASKGAKAANADLEQARGVVADLLKQGQASAADLQPVRDALDHAIRCVKDARESLTSLLKVADHAARLADEQLKGAGEEMAKAKADIARIVAGAKGGAVTKAALQDLHTWLADPQAELGAAQRQLAGDDRVTRKFPSDNEDGGIGGAVTLKYPSDNEDGGPGGPGGGGGVFHTMKAPSDNEDGGPGPDVGGTPGAASGKLKESRIHEIRGAWADAQKTGNIQWVASMPLGQRFETVPLYRERHPDGYAFEALIPTGALTPTAPQQDPNKVESFWIRRTGGFAGLTQYAGPFSLKPDTNPGIRMPTKEQMTAAVRSIAEAALKNGTAVRLSGPPVSNPNDYPSFDITPNGLTDVNKTVFDIRGELYLRTSGWGPGGTVRSTWDKIGSAPMF